MIQVSKNQTLFSEGLGALKTFQGNIDRFCNMVRITIRNSNLPSFQFLEVASSLKYLNLTNNGISDISFIESIPSLMVLILSNNRVRFLEPLSVQTQIIELNLSFNLVTDVSPLQSLKRLNTLSLIGNKQLDFTTFNKLPNKQILFPLLISQFKLTNDQLQLFDLSQMQQISLQNQRQISRLPIDDWNCCRTINICNTQVKTDALKDIRLNKLICDQNNLLNQKLKIQADTIEFRTISHFNQDLVSLESHLVFVSCYELSPFDIAACKNVNMEISHFTEKELSILNYLTGQNKQFCRQSYEIDFISLELISELVY